MCRKCLMVILYMSSPSRHQQSIPDIPDPRKTMGRTAVHGTAVVTTANGLCWLRCNRRVPNEQRRAIVNEETSALDRGVVQCWFSGQRGAEPTAEVRRRTFLSATNMACIIMLRFCTRLRFIVFKSSSCHA